MDARSPATIAAHFADLPDPRIERARRHDLLDIVTIAVRAVIGGADAWVDVERFGRAKQAWFETFLALPNGVPSHDTFGRVFAALDPAAFETAFLGWVRTLTTATAGEVVAIDGKTLRRSHDQASGRGPLHLVNAWATTNRVALGQVATDDHSNEIPAIPALLDVLALEDAVVTIDAMGCQTETAGQLVDRGADYVLALKANQPTLHELVRHQFDGGHAPDAIHRTVDKDHDRRITGTISAVCRRMLSGSGRWCGRIGALRTGCTGCWMWRSARTRAGCAAGMPPRTWRSCASWR